MTLRFETGIEFIPGYRLLDRLGAGGFGEVWKCVAPGGINKAVKIIHGDLRSQNDDMIRYAEQELKAMKRVKAVRHPYLLAIDRYDIIEGRLLIVMELADCNLWDRFRQCRLTGQSGITRDELLAWMLEAAEVLDLMNFEHQLLHLDIKPQNIFLQYNHVKVGDFGQVKDLEGIMASVTGGITPVYAAPETFDGIVTRFCDQYSLACVYQELLSGVRPFDGSSMQQLMMQHLTSPPNLAPSPAGDRPVLAKALAKKPEERFGNCTEFIKAMKAGTPVATPPSAPIPHNATVSWKHPAPAAADVVLADSQSSSTGSSIISFATTPIPCEMEECPTRAAPPEVTGDGPLRPALVIGLGATGLRLLQQFRKAAADRFGAAAHCPAIRSLFIDTDPDTVASALTDRGWDGLPALKIEEVYTARLNRSAHYMKARPTGRNVLEGWFDPKWLHLLPRNPATQGFRPFGRLALIDHYRPLVQKIEADLDTILTPEALHATMEHTGLGFATNRPRVYLAASLAGGTGGGMVLDLAYILRNKLRNLGYAEADVVGVLFVPAEDVDTEWGPLVRGNVVAALTEFNHFAHAESVFQSYYDDRQAFLRDAKAPFREVMMVPQAIGAAPPVTPLAVTTGSRSGTTRSTTAVPRSGQVARSTTQHSTLRQLSNGGTAVEVRDTIASAAQWLRLELFGPLGRLRDGVHAARQPSRHATGHTFGLARHEWPRAEIIGRTARVVSGVMMDQWVSPDPGRAREVVPTWTAKLFKSLKLDMDGFIECLREAADRTLGADAEALLIQAGETAYPKGWLNRMPDAAQVGHALVKWDQFIGHPSTASNRQPTSIEDATRQAATDIATAAQAEITAAVPRLIDSPDYRLAGAEEASRQLLADLARMATAMNSQADALEKSSLSAYEDLSNYAKNPRAARSTGPELVEALKNYPKQRFQALLARRAGRTYVALKEMLTTVKNEMANCRQRLVGIRTAIMAELELPCPEPAAHQVMPPGCMTIDDAAKRYLDVLNDVDLHQIETWVQRGIDTQYGGLYQACLNLTEGSAALMNVLCDQTRAYLGARLGDVDLAAMFEHKYGLSGGIAEAVRQSFEAAAPELVSGGPWAARELQVLTAPTGAGGDPLRRAVHEAWPDPQQAAYADTPDECVVYREVTDIPLAALPQFGPLWQAAYDTAPDTLPCSLHARNDITAWISVDS